MTKKKEPRSCGCGCGRMTKGGEFCPGHDVKLKSALIGVVKGHKPGALQAGQMLLDRGWKTEEWVKEFCGGQIPLPGVEANDDAGVSEVEANDEEQDALSEQAVAVAGFNLKHGHTLLDPDADTPFCIDSEEWPTVTHYLLAMQLSSLEGREKIRNTDGVAWAKRHFAKYVAEGKNPSFDLWDELNNAVLAKVAFNDNVRKQLLSTGEAVLGWDNQDPELGMYGDNLLGTALMDARAAYR